ncbi:MAG: NAD-dependent DNA ligase LigA, partial [Syntrophomonadaceae bacterium]|nr:NAD-dependent DNA ligase LigA [Syntrophomonadaceae bacterium]
MTKEALQQEISLFDIAYEQGKPLISDTEYEKKLSELKKMEVESGSTPDSPTQVIPFIKVEGLETVIHNKPILSMDKVSDFPALFRWCRASKGVLIEPKLDGLTIVLRYSNGQLVDAITRGNGYEGERVLHTVQTIKNLPKTIPYGDELEVRGEVYIPFTAFNKVNNGEYANPRSMVAGTVRLLDPNEAVKRGLDIQIFDLLHCDLMFETAVQQYRFLWEQGFPIVPFELFFDKLTIEKYITKYEHETRARLPFPIDGVCVKYNELSLREKMGTTGRFPKYSMTFKFASLEEFTILRKVTWQIGKSGQLTPVANFDTITIDGVEINKATLHNFEFIQEKQIALNSKIVVARANDVIPKVVCAYP